MHVHFHTRSIIKLTTKENVLQYINPMLVYITLLFVTPSNMLPNIDTYPNNIYSHMRSHVNIVCVSHPIITHPIVNKAQNIVNKQ